MIHISVQLGDSGITRLESNGHARSEGNRSVVCAAVSAILRSAAETLGNTSAVVARGLAPEPGQLRIEVAEIKVAEWHEGVSDMLLTGLYQIQREYPEELDLSVNGKSRRLEEYGT